MNLSSASNRKITLLRKLNRKKYRYEERLFLVEGARAVEQLLQNGEIIVESLFFDEQQQYWNQQKWSEYLQETDSATLSSDLFAEISDTNTPQGVLALCHMPEEATVEGLIDQNGLVIAFDAIQDPGNLGTIIRTACWFGVNGLLSGKGTVDLFHPKVVRGTAGATGMIPHMNGNLSKILAQFEKAGWPVFLLDAGGDAMPLSDISSPDKAVIVAGNEAHGVSEELVSPAHRTVRISSPKEHSGVESLNVAVATSIALYGFGNATNQK